jgi:hypothetical protein
LTNAAEAPRWALPLDVIGPDEPIELVVVEPRGDTPASGVLDLDRAVADELRAIANQTMDELRERRAVPWSAQADLIADEYWEVQRDQLDLDAPALIALERHEHPDVAPTWLEEHRSVIYAISVGSPPRPGEADTRLVFVRKRTPAVNLSARATILQYRDGRLNRIDYPLLSFDRSVDLVLAPGRGMGVLNDKAFELLFRDAPELLERTPALARSVAVAARMTPEAERVLIEAAGRYSRVRRRLLAIDASGHLTTVDPKTMRAELRRWGFDPRVHYRSNMLSFGPDDVQLMMKILNEDLLHGGLTARDYEVQRKMALET